MWTTKFWKQAAERAAKTAAQALIGLWALDGQLNLLDADLPLAGGIAGGAAVLSLLFSVASGLSSLGEPNDPSVVSR